MGILISESFLMQKERLSNRVRNLFTSFFSFTRLQMRINKDQ